MQSRDFCFWLQGYFEITDPDFKGVVLAPPQVQAIRNHLALVFKHEIDPSMGDQKHQNELNKIHGIAKSNPDIIYRC